MLTIQSLESLKINIKKLMLKNWTATEIESLDEFMEDVIIATVTAHELPIQQPTTQSCDSCKHLSTCRFWQNTPNNGATCKFYIKFKNNNK